MNTRYALLAASLLLTVSTRSFADCAGDATVRDVTASFTKAQNAEKTGDLRAAFEHFVAAQEYTCDDPNPIAANAAARAASLSKPLAQAAAAKGDLAAAFDLHERGGHFREADRALLAWTEAQQDDPGLYTRAMGHFEYRASPAFADNEKVRLAITGKYTLDPALAVRVRGMPLRGVERALAAESKAFDEPYLQQRLALAQSRPENLLDGAAREQYIVRAQALQAQRRSDALEDSRNALALVRAWTQATRNPDEELALTRRLEERAHLRVSALTGKYAGAPDLMAESTDYLTHLYREPDARSRREAQIRRQAEQLGDAAMAQQKPLLAAEYFVIARADDKARRAQESSNARQRQQMQPAIDAARKNAEEMAATFADPAKVEAMKQQAREMQRRMEESAAARRTPAAQKSRDDMARELGL